MLRFITPQRTNVRRRMAFAHPWQSVRARLSNPTCDGGIEPLPYAARATRARLMSSTATSNSKLKWLEYIKENPHAYEPGGEGYGKIKAIVDSLTHTELQVGEWIN